MPYTELLIYLRDNNLVGISKEIERKELSSEFNKIQKLIDTIANGVIILHRDHTILYTNKSISNKLGQPVLDCCEYVCKLFTYFDCLVDSTLERKYIGIRTGMSVSDHPNKITLIRIPVKNSGIIIIWIDE